MRRCWADMLEDKSLVVGVGVEVVVVVVEVVAGVVLGNKSAHRMVGKLVLVGVGAWLRVFHSSLGHRWERTLACMLVGREEGVGVAQVVGEEWLGRVRNGVVVPSALGQEDGRMVEDTVVQSLGLLPLHLHFRFLPQYFLILQIHPRNHPR